MLDERVKFIAAYLENAESVAALCRRFGVSRETAHKFLRRYAADGLDGLRDRSRAPHTHPNAVTEAVIELILHARRSHPTWGPCKLRAVLARRYPGLLLPAPSTLSRVLRRAGLAARRKRGRPSIPLSAPVRSVAQPNELWCADFKGWWRARNGERCEPLTITDAATRYALACDVVGRVSVADARAVFERTFRTYGLPRALRTDNGSPFASRGLAGLTRLSAWWVQLGIRPERIAPGKPQQNGRHERFHRTLQETLAPAPTRRASHHACATFVREYNYDRPHAALGNQTPADCYTPSVRAYPARLAALEYPAACTVRTVLGTGVMKWSGQRVFISEALIGQRIGLQPLTDRHWTVYFGALEIGCFHEHERRLVPHDTPIWHASAAP